jgi:poly-gamma-glutamate synthesis protein (capsule biosynthesis protein)
MNGRCLRAALVLLLLSLKAVADAPVVSIAFVGDIMLDDTPGKVIRQGRDPFAPFAAILQAADYRIGNLECVVARGGTAEPRKPYTFRAHPRVLPVLRRHFDAVSLANNHSGDYGSAAFAEMLGRLEKSGVAHFGGGHTLAEAHAPLLVERKGLRIALLGYNEFFPRSFEADFDKPGIAWSEDEQVVLDIRRARSEHRADLVIPVMHWGWEHEPLAGERQRRLARLMIDAGADAVVGGHPHVTQDVETYRGKPIVYSLGNFVFDCFDDATSNTGWLLRVELDKGGVVGWQTVVAHLDKEGIPHPAKGREGQCWSRGMTEAGKCPAK